MNRRIFLYSALVLAFLLSQLPVLPPSFAALSPTNCILSGPSTGSYGQALSISLTLTNQTSGAAIQGASINFYVNANWQGQQSLGSSNTGSNGVATFSYTPQAVGTYVFSATFGGNASFSSCNSNSLSIPVSYSTGWGSLYSTSDPNEQVTSELQSTTGNWNATTPTYFQMTSEDASASFSYAIYDLTSFDMSERTTFGISDSLTPAFSWGHTFTLQVAGYTFEDIWSYTNGFYGVGSTSNRTLKTILPNGTIYSADISSNFNDWVRFVFYYDTASYYTLAWTLTSYPDDTLQVGSGPVPSAYQVNTANPLDLNMSLSFTASASGSQSFQIALNSISLSLGYAEGYSLDNTTSGNGGINMIGAITNAFASGISWIEGSITNFFSKTIMGGFKNLLNSLGVGWILTGFQYFIDALLILFAIIEGTLPYLGLIIVIINLYYVARLDFSGLFSFYVEIYNVVANIASVIIGIVQTVVDFIQSISSGAGAADMAAAAA